MQGKGSRTDDIGYSLSILPGDRLENKAHLKDILPRHDESDAMTHEFWPPLLISSSNLISAGYPSSDRYSAVAKIVLINLEQFL